MSPDKPATLSQSTDSSLARSLTGKRSPRWRVPHRVEGRLQPSGAGRKFWWIVKPRRR